MKRSLLKKVLIKSLPYKNNMVEEFDSVRFAECFKNYLLHNEVITNEAIHMQNTIKQMRLKFDNSDSERLSHIEDLDIYELNPNASDASGSSGDSGVNEIPFQGFEMKPLNQSEKQTVAEEIAKDIIYYFALINTINKQENWARRIIYCLHNITRHNFKTFAYLLRL